MFFAELIAKKTKKGLNFRGLVIFNIKKIACQEVLSLVSKSSHWSASPLIGHHTSTRGVFKIPDLINTSCGSTGYVTKPRAFFRELISSSIMNKFS